MARLTRRQAFRSVAGGALASVVARAGNRRAGDKPNLLFLLTDEQRADTTAAYGNTRFHVPNMNRLGSESVVFDSCYASQPVCSPSRSSILSGQWPHTTGVRTNNLTLPPAVKTLPELLADSSYRTAYYGKWHLGDELFAQHGFEDWLSVEDGYNKFFSPGRDRNTISDYAKYLIELGYKPDKRGGDAFSRVMLAKLPLKHRKPNFIASQADEFILKNREQPWLLFCSFLEPHMPFYGPLNDLHSAEEAPVPQNYPGYPVDHEPRFYGQIRATYQRNGYKSYLSLPGHDLKNRDSFQRLNRNYAGLCSEVDNAFGRILWALEVSGQMENTIVVQSSDHGEMMGAHRLVAKEVMYEEAARVPLVIRAPFRSMRPGHVKTPVTNVDLVPTILELMNARIPESVEGQSLVPALNGQALKRNHAFLEWNTVPGSKDASPVLPANAPNGRTVVSPDGWKLVLYDRDNCMLFNHAVDPLEMNNLYYRSDSAPVIKRLRDQIVTWQKETGDQLQLP
jgi:arylsulfatase A-like enzyme